MKAYEMQSGKQYRYKSREIVFHEICGPGDFLCPIRSLNRCLVTNVGETDPVRGKWGIELDEEVEEI